MIDISIKPCYYSLTIKNAVGNAALEDTEMEKEIVSKGFSWVKEVTISQNVANANELLKDGWRLLDIQHLSGLPLFLFGK